MIPLPPECQRLVEALGRATARLGALDRSDPAQIEQVLAERLHAIEALTEWIAAEQRVSRPVSAQLATHLAKDLETGAEILVRLALDRERARTDLMALGRELQMLRGLTPTPPAKPATIDYQG